MPAGLLLPAPPQPPPLRPTSVSGGRPLTLSGLGAALALLIGGGCATGGGEGALPSIPTTPRVPAEQRAAFERALEPVRLRITPDAEYADRVYARAFAELGVDVDAQADGAQTNGELLAALGGVSPRAARALDGWARACVSLGSEHYERANRRRALALALDPDPLRAELRRAFVESDLTGVREVALSMAERELPPESALYVAETLEYTEDPELAIRTLLAAIERYPDHFGLHLGAGHHLVGLLRPQEAIEHLQVARDLDPTSLWPLVQLGRAQRLAEEFDEALASCRLALAEDPGFLPAYRILINIYVVAGDHAREIEGYRALVRLEPRDAVLLNAFAWQLATSPDLAARDGAQAVRHAQRAVAIDPERYAFQNTLGVSLYRAGELDRCIAALERSIEMSISGEPSDFLFLALAWVKLGEPDIGREYYERALLRIEECRLEREWTPVRSTEVERFLAEVRQALGIEGQGDG